MSPGSMFCLRIDGQARPKERPRVIIAKNGRARGLTPPKTKAWEEEVAWRFRLRWPGLEPDPEGRYSVHCIFHLKGNRRIDTDNLLKSVLDALNGIVWEDDYQVERISARREQPSLDPHVSILIQRLEVPNVAHA